MKTVIDIRNQEEKFIVKIRDFLRANAGLAYSAKDITDKTGIECVENLLYYTREDYAKAIGIKQITTTGKTSFDICCSEYRYYCKSSWAMRWREFWDSMVDIMVSKST